MNLYSYTINNPVKYVDPSGLIFDKVFKNEKQLGGHSNKAVTYQEFIRHVGNRSLHQMQTENGRGGLLNSTAQGPESKYRYVIDPANPNHIIDMRHFLVVGPWGEYIGMFGEIMQYTKPEDRPSAFDAQDFLSNYLGSEFFQNYYLRYNMEMTFSEILQKYFNDRAGEPCPK